MDIQTANRLVQFRKEAGLSQEELARRLGVSRQAVSKWERAESSPDTDNLVALARLYCVSLDSLVGVFSQEEPVGCEDAAKEEDGEGDMTELLQEERAFVDWRRFPYPLVVVVLYLLLGALFHLWHPMWLLFLTIPIYYVAADGAFRGRDVFKIIGAVLPVAVSLLYLALGFAFGLWHPGWVLFLFIPLYYALVESVRSR